MDANNPCGRTDLRQQSSFSQCILQSSLLNDPALPHYIPLYALESALASGYVPLFRLEMQPMMRARLNWPEFSSHDHAPVVANNDAPVTTNVDTQTAGALGILVILNSRREAAQGAHLQQEGNSPVLNPNLMNRTMYGLLRPIVR